MILERWLLRLFLDILETLNAVSEHSSGNVKLMVMFPTSPFAIGHAIKSQSCEDWVWMVPLASSIEKLSNDL